MYNEYVSRRCNNTPNRSPNLTTYGGQTEEYPLQYPWIKSGRVLFSRDLPNLVPRTTMGNTMGNKIVARENSLVRRKSSSSHSVSGRDKHGEKFENKVNTSAPKKTPNVAEKSTLSHCTKSSNGAQAVRRNSSDSGYNSSGKAFETQTGLSNGLHPADNKSCGKRLGDYNPSISIKKQDTYRSDSTHLLSNKPELCKKSGSVGSRESLSGRSSSRTSSDLSNSRSYVNERSMLSKLPKSGSEGLVGLQNLGNTCFMNSILQCLSNCCPLRDKMLSGSSLQYNRHSKMKGKLFSAFADLIKAMWSRNRPDISVSPNSFKTQIQRFSPRFVGFEQQDSQEFLRFLLEGLNEDLNEAVSSGRRSSSRASPDLNKLSEKELSDYMWEQYKSRDNSLVTDLFCGQIMSTLTCMKCSNRSVTFDPFWDLSLPIPRHSFSYSSSRFTDSSVSLSDCVKLFTKKEELDGDEKPKCERCKGRQKCQKQIKIHRFPRILVIHLKRFSGFGFRSKLQTDVHFPLNHLDMSNFASKCSDEFSNGDSLSVKYNLFAVSNHSGSAFGGHYTAYCKHPESKEWHSFNDSRVGALSCSSVRGSQAYVLFYERDES